MNLARALLIISFTVLLWGPLVLNLLLPDRPISLVENRPLAVLPEFPRSAAALKVWPAEFAAYYDDHLGGRETLVYWHNRIKFSLGISPSDKVLLGREGWLYYAGVEADGVVDPIRDLRGQRLFTEAELAGWAANLDSKRRWLAGRGIEFLFVIAPNKASIYPEFLPNRIKPGARRTDQLLRFLAEHSEVEILDLRPVLLAAKEEGVLYHHSDTHWNALGAWYAQNAVITALQEPFSDLMPLPKGDVLWQEQLGGDLAQMLGMRLELSESKPQMVFTPCAETTAPPPDYPERSDIRSCAVKTVRGLLFRDSFADALIPFLAEHFQRLAAIWQRPDASSFMQWVNSEQPQLVIEQRAERYLAIVPDDVLPAD